MKRKRVLLHVLFSSRFISFELVMDGVVNATNTWTNSLDEWLAINEPFLPTQSTEAFFAMFVAGVVVIYVSHLVATIYMLLKLWKQRKVFLGVSSGLKKIRVSIKFLLIFPLLFTLVKSLSIIFTSFCIISIYTTARLRITRASMISMGMALGLLTTYDGLGKEFFSLDQYEEMYASI